MSWACCPALQGTSRKAGSHENWGIFKCHKWGQLLRHSQLEAAGNAKLLPKEELDSLNARIHVSRRGQLTPYEDPHSVLAETKAGLDQVVRERAYLLWARAGRPDGRADDFWHQEQHERFCERAYALWEREGCPEGKADEPGFERARLKRLEGLSVMKIERLRSNAGLSSSASVALSTPKNGGHRRSMSSAAPILRRTSRPAIVDEQDRIIRRRSFATTQAPVVGAGPRRPQSMTRTTRTR